MGEFVRLCRLPLHECCCVDFVFCKYTARVGPGSKRDENMKL